MSFLSIARQRAQIKLLAYYWLFRSPLPQPVRRGTYKLNAPTCRIYVSHPCWHLWFNAINAKQTNNGL
jgi:hypothetical protein